MYEERKKRINWVRLFLVCIIVFLLILLALKVISLIRFNNNPTKYYTKQLETLNEAALKHYNKDNIPTEVGESSIIYLKDFKDKDINYELKVRKNDSCNLDTSYIRATRLESEYQVRSYIKCDNFEDSINTYVSLDGKKEERKEEETTTTTTIVETTEMSIPKEDEPTTEVKVEENTTKQVTTTTTTKKTQTTTTTKAVQNKVTIGFNTNGGEQLSSITVNKGSKVNLPTPVRNGYTFVGWYKNYQHYTNNIEFNDDIILVAKWTKN